MKQRVKEKVIDGGMPLQQNSEQLRSLLLDANFKGAKVLLDKNESNWLRLKPGESEKAPDFLEGLMLRSMIAEIRDYWGEYAKAEEVLKPVAEQCEGILEKVRQEGKQTQRTDQERGVLRQRVWIVIHQGMANYRTGRLDLAMEQFNLAHTITERHLTIPDKVPWGTRARIQYSIGLIQREQTKYQAALDTFNLSAEYAYLALEKARTEPSKITYVAISKSLGLGLAYIHSRIGRADLAFPLLLAARTILQAVKEEIIAAYVDLIYANTVRAIEQNPERVNHAIERLKSCYEKFDEAGHRLYRARTAFSLGAAYVERARPDESLPLTDMGKRDLELALKLTEDIREHAKASGDRRFGRYATLLASRIYRKQNQLDKAIEQASSVIENADDREAVKLDALMARGEVWERKAENEQALADFNAAITLDAGIAARGGVEEGKTEGAITNFPGKEVLESKANNPQLRARAFLHLAILYSRIGNDTEAARSFAEFEKLRHSVRHLHLVMLEARARREMELRSGNLLLRMDDDGLNFKLVEERVHKFLILWAQKHAETDLKAAAKLGISRQTFYNWQGKGRERNGS